MSIEFYETKFLRNIYSVINHPDVLPFMVRTSLNECPAINLKKLYSPIITVYALRITDKLAGIGFFRLENEIAIADVCFLPQFRGKDAKRVAMQAIYDYVRKKSPREITGKINKNNKRSYLFSRWLGFEKVNEDDEFYYMRFKNG